MIKKYKVLVEFDLDGGLQAADSITELDETVAAPYVAEGKLVEYTEPGEGEAV